MATPQKHYMTYDWQMVTIESTVPEEVWKELAFEALRDHEKFKVLHAWWKEELKKQEQNENQKA
jgi:hypothetical protein